MSKNVENNGNWLYFDYKYIGEKVNEEIFQVLLPFKSHHHIVYFILFNFNFSPYHGKNLDMKI